jgi:hypothetical protein
MVTSGLCWLFRLCKQDVELFCLSCCTQTRANWAGGVTQGKAQHENYCFVKYGVIWSRAQPDLHKSQAKKLTS